MSHDHAGDHAGTAPGRAPDPLYVEVVDDALDQILNHFLDEEAEAVFEVLGADGERLDTDDGRRITPGHAMESAAFVMHEAIGAR